jgi:hypothetical protein
MTEDNCPQNPRLQKTLPRTFNTVRLASIPRTTVLSGQGKLVATLLVYTSTSLRIMKPVPVSLAFGEIKP